MGDERVLARPARADHADEGATPAAHDTRCPARQTVRTIGATAFGPDADEIGAPADLDRAAVGKARSLCRRQRHRSYCGGKVHRGHPPRQLESGHEQARRNIVGGEDVEELLSRQRLGGDIARMRTAADDVGPAHHHLDSSGARRLRRFDGDGKFCHRHAVGNCFRDLGLAGIVMAGKHAALPGSKLDQLPAVARRVLPVEIDPLLDERLDVGAFDLAPAHKEAAPRREIAELPLARRVIHERDDMDRVALGISLRLLDHVGRGDFAAQMREVFGTQESGRGGGLNGIGERPQILAERREVGIGAGAERIVDRGDTGGGDLRVVGDHSAERVPADLWPRGEVALEMIGMELDQAGDDGVASQIKTCLGSIALAKIGDAPLRNRKPPAPDHAVRQDQRGVRQDEAVIVFHKRVSRSPHPAFAALDIYRHACFVTLSNGIDNSMIVSSDNSMR